MAAIVGGGPRPAPGRGEPRAPRRAAPRRAAGVPAAGARGAAPAARGRRRQRSRASAGRRRLPGALPARGDDEPLPVRRARRSRAPSARARAQRLAAYRDKLSRALLDRFDLVVTVPRPRARRARGAPGEPSAPVRGACRGRARACSRAAPPRRTHEADELLTPAVERLPLSGRGRARVARVARTIARARRRGRGRRRSTSPRRSRTARRRSSARRERARCSPPSRPRRARIVVDEPRERALRALPSRRSTSARISRALDERGRALASAAVDAGRSRRCSRDLTTRRRACSCAAPATAELLERGRRSRSSARAPARPTARRSRACSAASSPPPGSSSSAGSRAAIDGEAHRGALEAGGHDGRGARLRHRPRLPGRARASSPRRIAERGPGRLRVRPGRRAGAVAVPGAQPDRRRASPQRPSSSRRASGAAR